MNIPELLLFDLGGVLIESSAFDELNRLLPAPLDNATLKNRWLFSSAARRFELGEISPEQFAEGFVAEWGIDLSPDDFLNAFASWPRNFYPGAMETIQELRKVHRVACLSNSNQLHSERFDGFDEYFDVALFSHKLGVIKPDCAAFTLALNECEVEASAVCFYDDCIANIEMAQSLGINAFQVNGFDDLKATLLQQGFLAA